MILLESVSTSRPVLGASKALSISEEKRREGAFSIQSVFKPQAGDLGEVHGVAGEEIGDKLIYPAFACVLAFRWFSINGLTMTSRQAIMADLEALPTTALQKVADFVHQMRDTAATDRQAAFDASFGCMTAVEAETFERIIEEGCERIEP